MTKEGILVMEVGAELDALVQKRIFGKKALRIGNKNFPRASEEERKRWYLRCVSCGHQGPVSSAGFDMDAQSNICFNFCLGREGQLLRREGTFGELILPYYSTDISAAWKVKERLNIEGLLLELIDLSSGSLCRAEFWDNAGLVPSKVVGKAEADNTPEAICKAALLAVFGEVMKSA